MSTGVQQPSAPLGIIGAMAEELHALRASLQGVRQVERAGRQFLCGELAGRPVVLVRSGIGKVAAATTASLLLAGFGARAVVFTGVAGGLGEGVQVGDLVLADSLLQHDMDASPLFPRFEVPLYGRSRFATDVAWTDAAARAAAAVASATPGCRVHRGLIVSGDRFVATAAESLALRAALPEALAVEMEGAAVAQVCHDFGRPVAVMRSISDRADEAAHGDFQRFIEERASRFSEAVVRGLLEHGPW